MSKHVLQTGKRCALFKNIYLSNVFQFHRIPINYLIVNLAAADIMFAMFLAPKIILSMNFTHPKGMAGTIVCKLLTGGNMAWVGGISSIVTLNAIAIERYYAVVYPLGNKGKLTKRKLKVRQ